MLLLGKLQVLHRRCKSKAAMFTEDPAMHQVISPVVGSRCFLGGLHTKPYKVKRSFLPHLHKTESLYMVAPGLRFKSKSTAFLLYGWKSDG